MEEWEGRGRGGKLPEVPGTGKRKESPAENGPKASSLGIADHRNRPCTACGLTLSGTVYAKCFL